MSNSRERIFNSLRRGLGRGPEDAKAQAAVNARLSAMARNLVPQRAQLPHPQQVKLFIEKITALTVTVQRVASTAAVPDAVADYLVLHNLPTEIRMAPHDELRALPWQKRPLLQLSEGPGRATDLVSLTPAFAGIAETGTLMLHSGPQNPTTLHFTPDNHIVVLRASQISGSMEDAFAKLRAQVGGADHWPRTVNMVTGPSRTADIEGVPVLGAHGPRRLHVVLIEDVPQDAAQAQQP
ncbi:LUD domain-containing protein [Ferrovibrio sp.]|uniref:LutC/YkgG family protein n=1 Tax=Ferrovibrio sp. TaxID=1917215 RepID=UPI0025BBC65B|nr:LUD domain-containing protein [Ferrovibrio sp.]MBX3454528.1 LUD domain-containing protein [Ferrovibrio sp.]